MMIQIERVLCPIDFSDNAQIALRYAISFADKFGAQLHLVNVVQDLIAMVPEPGLAFPPSGNYMGEMVDSAEKGLAALPGEMSDKVTDIVRSVQQGPPFLEIIRYAKEHNIDMIVMSTHGRSGLAHILMGSTAEKVVRKAPCPVLTVRPEEHQFILP